ncbi:hypothetical protein QEN19_000874 [Hanseniaspora menglaensis]
MLKNCISISKSKLVRFNSSKVSYTKFQSTLNKDVEAYFNQASKDIKPPSLTYDERIQYKPLSNLNDLYNESVANLEKELPEITKDKLELAFNDPSNIYQFENTFPKLHSYKNKAVIDYNSDINRFFLHEKWTMDKSRREQFSTSPEYLKNKVNSFSSPVKRNYKKDGVSNHNSLDPNHKETLITHDDTFFLKNKFAKNEFGTELDKDLIGGKYKIFQRLEQFKLLPDTIPTAVDLNTILRFRFPFSDSSFHVYSQAENELVAKEDLKAVEKEVKNYNNPMAWIESGEVLNNDVLKSVPEFQIFDLRREKITTNPSKLMDISLPKNLDELKGLETEGANFVLDNITKQPISIDEIKETKYTLLMMTPDVIDYKNASYKSKLNYCISDIEIKDFNDNFVSEFREGVNVVKSYEPPMPMKGETKAQRYLILLLEQPKEFDSHALKTYLESKELGEEGELDDHFSVRNLIKQHGLQPIGANCFRAKYDSFLPMTVDHHTVKEELKYYRVPDQFDSVRKYKIRENI